MQVMPNTRAIPNGTIQARTRVEVQVNVDQAGRVSSAHVASSGVNEQISAAALSAARRWTFDPASNNGQRVNSEHTIVFEFRPEQR
jgi:periplasmic protein TonB